ncbi:MAG: hypothetical protein WBA74_03670 [Cyclobacteriaceae bacterium]
MSYNDDLERYELEAEDQFDDYDEDYQEEDDFDTGLDGYEDGYYDEDEEDGFYEEVEYLPAVDDEDGYDSYDDEDYDSYKATSIGRIDANDRTLTVVVANTSGGDAEAILFGGNQDAAQPAGVTVVVEESSHKEVKEESKANPFKIQGMKMSSSDALQFDNVLKVTRRTATGSNTTRVYQPRNATSPQNFSQSLIDDSSFEMDVTGQDSLRFNVRNGATVVFTFTIKARANMGNLLKGHNVAELSRAPRTTGLPQLDLLQRKKKKKRKKRAAMKKVVRRIPLRGKGKPSKGKRKRR